MIVLFEDNLFFYLGGQSVSCKASLAALRLYGYFYDIVSCYYRRINMMMMMMFTNYELNVTSNDLKQCFERNKT